MIEWLQNNLDSIQKEMEEAQDNQSASEKSEEEEVSPEEQEKIDAEMAKRTQKKKGVRAPVCAEVYGLVYIF